MKVSFENYSISIYRPQKYRNCGHVYSCKDLKIHDSVCFTGVSKPVINSAKSNAELITAALDNMMKIIKLNNRQKKIMEAIQFSGRRHIRSRMPSESFSNKYADKIYEKENGKLDLIVDNMIKATFSKDIENPSSILLSGDFHYYNRALVALSNKIHGLYNLSILTSANLGKNAKSNIKKILDENRAEYLESGKRSVIFIERAERLIGINEESAEILGIDLSENDRTLLRNMHSNNEVAYFKSLFDSVSKLPDMDSIDNEGYATTFILTTENPHLIHPDLITREGKMTNIFYDIPNGLNLKNIILFHINRYNDKFTDVLSDKDWLKLLKELNPNRGKGGFSENKIKEVISEYYSQTEKEKQASTLEDELNILKNILEAERDIKPEECRKFYMLAKKYGYRIMEEDKDTLEDLLFQKELGLLTPKTTALLEEKLNDLEKELDTLRIKCMQGNMGKKSLKRMHEIEKLLSEIKTKGADNEGTV